MKNIQTVTGEGSGFWLIKAFSGLFLVVILGIHLVVNHLVYEGGLMSWKDVVIYYQEPAIIILEAIFLITVVTHALMGLRGVILDLQPSSAALAWVNALFLLSGLIAIGYGVWLLRAVASFG